MKKLKIDLKKYSIDVNYISFIAVLPAKYRKIDLVSSRSYSMKKIGIMITDPEDWTARALTTTAREKGFTPFTLDLRTAKVSINSKIEYTVHFKTGDISLSDFDAFIVRDAGAGAFECIT